MAVVIVDFTAFPQALAVSGAQLTALNDGKWRATYTPTLSSAALATGGNFYALTAANDLGGLWMYDDGGTLKVALFQNVSGSPIIVEAAVVRNAGAPFTVVMDNPNDEMVLSGTLTSGAGTHAFTGSTTGDAFGTSPLGGGAYGGGGFSWAGSMSDIDDGNDETVRTSAGTNAVDAVLAAARTVVRAAAGTVAVAAALAASRTVVRGAAGENAVEASLAMSVTGGEVTRDAAGSNAVDASLAMSRTVVRGAAGSNAVGASLDAARTVVRGAAGTNAVDAALAMTIAGGGTFGPGARSSAINPIDSASPNFLSAPGGALITGGGTADADGRTPVAVDTQATGSAIYYAVSRPAAVVGTAITDNKSNTYTQLHTGTYNLGGSAQWQNATGVCIGATGGTNHVLTTQSVALDEATLGWDEIEEAHYLADSAHAFVASGSTQQSPAVDLEDAGWVYVDWFGDGNTFGAEGFLWTVTATGEGTNLGDWQVCDARITNHNNGWIQWKRWRRYFATATSNIRLTLVTLNPNQGADWYAASFQEFRTVARTSAGTNAVDAALAASRSVVRGAPGSNAAEAALAAQRTAIRTAAGENAVAAALAANRVVTGIAAGTNATEAALAMTRTVVRSGAATNATDAALAMARIVVRAAAGANATEATLAAAREVIRAAGGVNAVEAALDATLVPGGTATRTAAGSNAVDATLEATRTVVRAAAGESVTGAALAMARTVVRTAAGSNAVAATLAMTIAGSVVALPSMARITLRHLGTKARIIRPL